MGRYQTTFPFTFNNAPGDQPGSRLDADYDAVNQGILTIRAQELSDGNDYNVVQDDEYTFFVCKGVDDFQIIPPVAPPTGFGFFFSNETRQEAIEIGVTLCCTISVGTVVYTNPVIIRDFPPFFLSVKGGLVQYDGNKYNLYPLYFASTRRRRRCGCRDRRYQREYRRLQRHGHARIQSAGLDLAAFTEVEHDDMVGLADRHDRDFCIREPGAGRFQLDLRDNFPVKNTHGATRRGLRKSVGSF